MQDMRIEMYIPLHPFTAAEELKHELLDGAGGSTQTRGLGKWIDSEGNTITEEVDIITIFVEDTPDNRLWIEAAARRYKEDADQDCVLYVLNGNETFFIED